MRPDNSTNHANLVFKSPCYGKTSLNGHKLPLVTDSWQRCIKAYGLDPAENHTPSVLDSLALKEHQEKAGALLNIARLEIENLFKSISSSGYAILLTNAEGIIISRLCDPTLDKDFRKAGLWLGADWSERNEGTNGIGTCIAERKAVTIHRNDHFRSCNTKLSCSASPILSPMGELLAVLDSSSANCRESRPSQSHIQALVRISASLIERSLFLTEYRNEYLLHFHSQHECVGLHNDAVLAISEAGKILSVNHNALELLGKLRRADLVGRSINEVLDTSPSTLELRTSKHIKNVWHIREVRSGKQFFATLSREEKPSRWSPPPVSPNPASSNPSVYHGPSLNAIAGEDPKMVHNIQCALRVIDKGIPVLLCGDTGTGKEAFAKAIHANGARKDQNFVAINCASIPESLIESELFGYSHGAFTGAKRQGMKGKIIQANGGTLFLDEIGDMPVHLQSRLLRVLEEKEVCPLGCEKSVAVDFNVISATHRDLNQLVIQEEFREDLYYRLNGLYLTLPNLRDRQDKERLIYQFFALEHNSGERVTLDKVALERLLDYPWPGNIRQLKNVLRVAIALCNDDVVRLADLPSQITDWSPEDEPLSEVETGSNILIEERHSAIGSEPTENANNMLESAEREALLMALASHCWNITDTAASLSISRATLYRKLKKYGLPPSKPK
ncbi:MAG: sigma-54-dependent Fis family transcriptional regulator [Gammaproteobacteria bacterium]|nr:sigma-54-dependent Fis family transcriptional regulator [Gammaproteobacteria bacterium]